MIQENTTIKVEIDGKEKEIQIFNKAKFQTSTIVVSYRAYLAGSKINQWLFYDYLDGNFHISGDTNNGQCPCRQVTKRGSIIG